MEMFVLDLNPFGHDAPLDTLYHMIVNFNYLTPDISQHGVVASVIRRINFKRVH
jgi:hypothetical protein